MVEVEFIVDAHNTYQAGLNVHQVANEGFAGLIVKATEGATGYTAPPMFDTWIQQARDTGMVPGAYHWLTNATVSKQLDHFLGRIGSPTGLICALDVEAKVNVPSWDNLVDFVVGWKERTGGHPLMIYSSNWWWGVRGWLGVHLTPYLWDSRYVSGRDYASRLYGKVPASWWKPTYGGWPRATMLQFSASALVAGKYLDVSAFEGTRQQLAALAGLEGDPIMTDVDLSYNGWNKGPAVGSRGPGLLLEEIWRAVKEGHDVYDTDEQEGTSFLATHLRGILAGVNAVEASLSAAGGNPDLVPVVDAMTQLGARLADVEATVARIEAALGRVGVALTQQ